MKKTILLFFVFAFSLGFAQLIDYDSTSTMGPMYQYLQGSSSYYTEQDVQYHLETELSIPSSQSERWLSGSGSYNDIHDGDVVCEGLFYYDTGVSARADMGAFDGRSPTVASSDTSSWQNCGSSPYGACPEGNTYVIWGTPHYGSPASHTGSRTYSTSRYRYREMAYQEVASTSFITDKVSDVATVLSGTASLAYAKSGGYSLYTFLHSFSPLTGTQPSHSGSFTVNVASGASGEYVFNQRMDVTGGTIVAYNVYDYNERFWSYDTLGSGQSKYTRSNIHDSASITIVDEDDVGIIDPYIVLIDLDSYEVEPGDDVPVTITMYIPARPSNFHALPFEFYNVNVGGSSGATFSEVSGINQCGFMFAHINGGWFGNSAYTSDIEGTLHIPSTLGPGTHSLPFTVAWQSCAGAEDCDGNGVTGTTPQITITVDIPDDSPDPDLSCTVIPTAYVNGTLPGPDGFALGEGVESWEVTVTNNGPGNATIDTAQMQACSLLVFNAYNSDSTEAFDPFWWSLLLTSIPDQMDSGESISWDIDGEAICMDTGDDVFALAWLNLASIWYPACTPYMIEETNYYNNVCGWSAPCDGSPPEITGCEITPTHVGDPGPNTNHSFALTCSGLPCTGAVTWDATGDPIGSITSSSQTGADVQVVDYDTESDYSGAMMLHATVATPDDMICNATIDIDVEGTGGEGDYGCELTPHTQIGYAGSHHRFYITCSDSEDPGDDSCDGGVLWAITEGDEHTTAPPVGNAVYADLVIRPDLMLTQEGELVRIVATWNDVTCDGEVLLPLEDCMDFI